MALLAPSPLPFRDFWETVAILDWEQSDDEDQRTTAKSEEPRLTRSTWMSIAEILAARIATLATRAVSTIQIQVVVHLESRWMTCGPLMVGRHLPQAQPKVVPILGIP